MTLHVVGTWLFPHFRGTAGSKEQMHIQKSVICVLGEGGGCEYYSGCTRITICSQHNASITWEGLSLGHAFSFYRHWILLIYFLQNTFPTSTSTCYKLVCRLPPVSCFTCDVWAPCIQPFPKVFSGCHPTQNTNPTLCNSGYEWTLFQRAVVLNRPRLVSI